jgi:hypothetical protein
MLTRYVLSGNVMERYQFRDVPKTGFYRPRKFHGTSKNKKDESSGRFLNNLNRTKKTVRRLIDSNFTSNDKFLTLTFRENVQDISFANNAFKQFIQRLRVRFPDFKYLAVLEFQKRGAVHYHVITDLPFVHYMDMYQTWGQGYIDIHKIRHVNNVGLYVTKYMQKGLADSRLAGKKAYQCSKNLAKPVILDEHKNKDFVDSLDVYSSSCEPSFSSVINAYRGDIDYARYRLPAGLDFFDVLTYASTPATV